MKEITLAAKLENIPVVTEFIEGELEAVGCPMKAQLQIDVAIDEVFTNIASYAYETGDGSAVVRFEFDEDTRIVCITFIDNGVPFDPLSMEEPDVTLPAEKRQVGGLGIFLVRKTMDDVKYEYRDGRNVLSIYKKI